MNFPRLLRARSGTVLFAALVSVGSAGCGTDRGADPDPGGGGDPSAPSLTRSVVTAFPQTIAPQETSTITLVAKNGDGEQLTTGGLAVTFGQTGGTSQGTIGSVTDAGDGTYAAAFLGQTEGTPTTITATIDGNALTSAPPQIRVLTPPALTDTTGPIPLIDMAGYSYHGFPGLLYPEGNQCPPAHVARQPPVDTSAPFVFLSIGMSNVMQEFCDVGAGNVGPLNCKGFSFVGRTVDDPTLQSNLVIVTGAQGGRVAVDWNEPTDPAYDVADARLATYSMSPADVQVIWCKMANKDPVKSLPDPAADAYALRNTWADVIRAAKTRYPNLEQMYLSSRIWSCANPGTLNPEPMAYESGFSAKWLIEEQIDQLNGAAPDPAVGDLSLSVAPWLAWGPYLWANGSNPNSEGLSWNASTDYKTDCTHPSDNGKSKVAIKLVEFFKGSPLTTPWFLK